ncbi:erythromycin esterase family protein [Hymenobacter arizonensis]|uniref:Erythromycin esterase homolog n=1 Tax=Hymenobacter arizonensis TaxID=1227077 RepID=A0A1I5ZRA3_HYMAR|nr:erythromycin esterase family protein [Hymenobacter arizonensis]SFQ58962.1 Erythromycin esterase homolog [Hymenobacter arizonensis]
MKHFPFALLLSWCVFFTSCTNKNSDAFPNSAITIPEQGVSRLETPKDLDPLLNQLGPARYALLGEASHGTAEFYTWRSAITKRLIQEKGYNLIGVEGDWPDMYELNRYVKGANNGASATAVLQRLKRWPTWMWANTEIAELAEWLRTYNSTQPAARKVGFYGLDVYSLWESLQSIRTDFPEADPATRQAVDAALDCLGPYNQSDEAYGRATMGGASCAEAVANVLAAVRNRMKTLPPGHEGAFNAEQNALVAVNAERYNRAAVRSSTTSWNIRDQHMAETINRLMAFHGPTAKIAVWEHNTHVGDARHTDMANRGEVNVGQLMREQHASAGVYIVGFGTYAGTVTAAPRWGGPVTTMPVPAAQSGSWEAVIHEQRPGNNLFLLDSWRGNDQLTQRRGNRAIGVVYNPASESGNYVPTNLPQRYDAFIFIEQTQALRPLPNMGG